MPKNAFSALGCRDNCVVARQGPGRLRRAGPIALLTMIWWLTFVPSAASQISSQCSADQYFERPGPTDPVITQFALTLRSDECPVNAGPMRDGYDLSRGQALYFFARLQGTIDYARSSRIFRRISLRIFQLIDGERLLFGALDMKVIDRQDAIREAEQTGGVFDWRLGARKVVFVRPGLYEARIVQGEDLICITDPIAGNCVVKFNVQ
jgi:hypothetical protein